ncbi:hypothetical protein FB107DRAFT_252760 [Schizophyllum commune]
MRVKHLFVVENSGRPIRAHVPLGSLSDLDTSSIASLPLRTHTGGVDRRPRDHPRLAATHARPAGRPPPEESAIEEGRPAVEEFPGRHPRTQIASHRNIPLRHEEHRPIDVPAPIDKRMYKQSAIFRTYFSSSDHTIDDPPDQLRPSLDTDDGMDIFVFYAHHDTTGDTIQVWSLEQEEDDEYAWLTVASGEERHLYGAKYWLSIQRHKKLVGWVSHYTYLKHCRENVR